MIKISNNTPRIYEYTSHSVHELRQQRLTKYEIRCMSLIKFIQHQNCKKYIMTKKHSSMQKLKQINWRLNGSWHRVFVCATKSLETIINDIC